MACCCRSTGAPSGWHCMRGRSRGSGRGTRPRRPARWWRSRGSVSLSSLRGSCLVSRGRGCVPSDRAPVAPPPACRGGFPADAFLTRCFDLVETSAFGGFAAKRDLLHDLGELVFEGACGGAGAFARPVRPAAAEDEAEAFGRGVVQAGDPDPGARVSREGTGTGSRAARRQEGMSTSLISYPPRHRPPYCSFVSGSFRICAPRRVPGEQGPDGRAALAARETVQPNRPWSPPMPTAYRAL